MGEKIYTFFLFGIFRVFVAMFLVGSAAHSCATTNFIFLFFVALSRVWNDHLSKCCLCVIRLFRVFAGTAQRGYDVCTIAHSLAFSQHDEFVATLTYVVRTFSSSVCFSSDKCERTKTLSTETKHRYPPPINHRDSDWEYELKFWVGLIFLLSHLNVNLCPLALTVHHRNFSCTGVPANTNTYIHITTATRLLGDTILI